MSDSLHFSHNFTYTQFILLCLFYHVYKESKFWGMAMFFFIAHEKGFKFHAQPQTGAYSCFHLKASAKMVLINSYPYKQ